MRSETGSTSESFAFGGSPAGSIQDDRPIEMAAFEHAPPQMEGPSCPR